MKIIVKVTDGKRTYIEDVTEDCKEYWNEVSTNGANSWLTDFKRDHRPIKETLKNGIKDLDKYNTQDENSHFIYGWWECFMQSDNIPMWMYEAEILELEVTNE